MPLNHQETQELEALIDKYTVRSANPDWHIDELADVPHFQLKQAGSFDSLDKLTAATLQRGRPLYLVPLNSWYRKVHTDPLPRKKDLTKTLRLGDRVPKSLTPHPGIFKINHENCSVGACNFSYPLFMGPLPKNSSVILFDDHVASGSTMRSFARYAASFGVNLCGTLCSDARQQSSVFTGQPLRYIEEEAQYILQARDALDTAENKKILTDRITNALRETILPKGQNLNQLTQSDVYFLMSRFRCHWNDTHDFDETIRRTASTIIPPKNPITTADIHEPAELLAWVKDREEAEKMMQRAATSRLVQAKKADKGARACR